MGAATLRVAAPIPEGVVENVGDKLGVVSRRVEGDLKRYKEFVESRSTETGAWRGEIHGGEVDKDTDTTKTPKGKRRAA